MKRLAKINRVFEARSGVNTKGNPWVMQDIEIEWEEQEPNMQSYTCKLIVTLNKKMKTEAVDTLTKSGQVVSVSFYPDTHDYNQRVYNSIRAFIPNEYTEEIK